MKIFLCLVFLFFLPSNGKLANETTTPPSASCQANITCPTIVAPLCARVMKKNQAGPAKKSIFIVVVNKCEMQYMKCHQGIEAAIVPMKNCEAGHGKPISKPLGLIKKRVKRQAEALESTTDVNNENRILTHEPVLQRITNTSKGRKFWKAFAPFFAKITGKAAKKVAKKAGKEAAKKAKIKAREEAKKKAKKAAEKAAKQEAEKRAKNKQKKDKKKDKKRKKNTKDYQMPDVSSKSEDKDDDEELETTDEIESKNDKNDKNKLSKFHEKLKAKKHKYITKPNELMTEYGSEKSDLTKEDDNGGITDDEDIGSSGDSTKSPSNSSGENDSQADEPTERQDPANDRSSKKPPHDGSSSDFDSQMKKFEDDMKEFHKDFQHVFKSANTGDGYSKDMLKNHAPLNPKDVVAHLKAFHEEISTFENDMKKFDSKLSVDNPRVSQTEEAQAPGGTEADDPMQIRKEEYKTEEDIDEEDEKSPEDPGLVMPPPGGGAKVLAGEDDIIDVNGENVGEEIPNENGNDAADGINVDNGEDAGNNGEDVVLDENGDENGADAGDGINVDNGEDAGNKDEDVIPDENGDGNGADAGNNDEDATTHVKGEENAGGFSNNDGIDKEDNIPPLKLGDWQDYTSECPKDCPSRDVMICARCTHDVYRTFLSTCHLRMFACEQPDEKLQLVSRTACAASAPFLADLSDSVKRVKETGDDDTVLRFVYCRMKGMNGGKSPAEFEGTNAKCDIAAPV